MWIAALLTVGVMTATTAGIGAAEDKLHIQFTGDLAPAANTSVVEIDSDIASSHDVIKIQESGRTAICYISAGSLERYRSDADRFSNRFVGRKLVGWSKERWLDIRKRSSLRLLMRNRVQTCAAKGFDGVEFDNVDGYQNRTGFNLTRRHQLKYNKMLARLATDAGLSPGLKNAVGLVRPLAKHFDWALNEECVTYSECSAYKHFTKVGKPVFIIEYGEVSKAKVCRKARHVGATAQIKRLKLNGWARHC
jgi:hypothetical protein